VLVFQVVSQVVHPPIWRWNEFKLRGHNRLVRNMRSDGWRRHGQVGSDCKGENGDGGRHKACHKLWGIVHSEKVNRTDNKSLVTIRIERAIALAIR
jgi:hypothetical protein